MKSRFLSIVKKIAFEGVLFFGYILGATIIFGIFFFLMLAYFVSPEVFSLTVIQKGFFNTVGDITFFGSIAILGVLFCVTQWVVFRKTTRLSLQTLRFFVASALLFSSYMVSFSGAAIFLERASFDPKYGKVLPYEKRCLENRTFMMRVDDEGHSVVVSAKSLEYMADNSCQAVYYSGRLMKDVDWKSFQVIDAIYAKDRYHAYIFGRPIQGADATTFSRMENSGDFLTSGNVYQAYDSHSVYGISLGMGEQSIKYPFLSLEKHDAFSRGVLFPGVEEMGHCHVLRRYDGHIMYRDVNKRGTSIGDDQFTLFSPLSDEFNHSAVRIQETEDCSEVSVNDGKISHRYRMD